LILQNMKVLVVLYHRFELWNAPSWFTARLKQDFPQLEIVHLTTYDGIEIHLPDAEIAITWSLRPEQFKLAHRLRWIHSPAAAVHQLMFPELINSDIILTNAREVHGPVVAEHVIALIFALAKRLPDAVRFQHEHEWGQELMWQSRPRPREVSGATLGLIGLGSIGREVATRAAALGMRVIAVRQHPEKGCPPSVERVVAPSQIDLILAESDYVVLAAPVTASTLNLIDSAGLGKMTPQACLINVSRGPLVDERALIHALRERQIGGAALDVFEEEPLPQGSELWDLNNLLITPHTAGLTDRLWDRHYLLVHQNLQRYLNHEPLLAIVDKKRGY
jgi:phosphoglycerate dehydrogenase-like enzyme